MTSLLYLLPGAMLGAILSYILPFVVGGFKYLARLNHQRSIEGRWYSYHITRHLYQPRVRQMRWKMRKDFRGHFTAACSGEDIDPARGRPPANQKGTAISESGHLFITVYDREDRYHVTCLIREPGRFKETSLGLWLGRDLDGKMIAGPMIFTRDELSLDEAESLLKSSVSTRAAFRLLEPKQQ